MNEALSILRKKTKYQLSEIKKKIVAKRLQTAQGEIKHGIFLAFSRAVCSSAELLSFKKATPSSY